MKGRDQVKAPPVQPDSFVRFPARAHLSLIPKPICSPIRPERRGHHRRGQSHHLRSLRSSSISHGSPSLLPPKDDHIDTSEPSSPKVTCAGQIKVRPPKNSSENWKTRSSWSQALKFVTSLRNLRFDFRCLGTFTAPDVISDNDDGEAESTGNLASESDYNHDSRNVFYNLYMILNEDKDDESVQGKEVTTDQEEEEEPPVEVPPQNALILMRCRSAPAKSLQEEEEEEEGDGDRRKQKVVVMKYAETFPRFSAEVVKETWVV